jgi:hypothetical protein
MRFLLKIIPECNCSARKKLVGGEVTSKCAIIRYEKEVT